MYYVIGESTKRFYNYAGVKTEKPYPFVCIKHILKMSSETSANLLIYEEIENDKLGKLIAHIRVGKILKNYVKQKVPSSVGPGD